MKTIKLAFALIIATLAMTACVEDKVYEGPNNIDAVSITPEAPTSFDEVIVTAKVSGLLAVEKAVLQYTVDGETSEVPMVGDGKTYTATIPAQADGKKVSYVVIITNEAGYTSTVEKDYTVGDKPSDFTKLVINEVYGAASEDKGKYVELYNNGDDPIKLKGVVIKKDEADDVWVGEEGEVIMGHDYFCIVGAKNALGEGGSGPNPRPMSKGLSSKKNVILQVFDPNGNLVNKFQRGEKGTDGWGNVSLTDNNKTWSRCPNGTGKFMIADGSLGTKNPDTGTEDPTVIQ